MLRAQALNTVGHAKLRILQMPAHEFRRTGLVQHNVQQYTDQHIGDGMQSFGRVRGLLSNNVGRQAAMSSC